MPLFDFKCADCGLVFEALVKNDQTFPVCPDCKNNNTEKLLSAPSFSIKGAPATGGVEKRVKEYLKAGKFTEATRFADKAASLTKSDKVKRIQDKLHKKTGF